MSPLITLCIRVEKAFPSDFPLVQNVRPPRIRQAKATLGSILLKEAIATDDEAILLYFITSRHENARLHAQRSRA